MHLDPALQPVQRQPLALRVAHTIKRYILSENLQPGDALPAERQLAESLVISRTVLREALGILVGEGLITKEAGRGIFVLPFDRDRASASFSLHIDAPEAETEEWRQFRVALEVGALGFSVPRLEPAHLARLRDLVRKMEDKLAKGVNIATEDSEFHLLLLDATGNRLFGQFRFLIEDMVRLSVETNPRSLREERDERSVRTMAALVEAIAAGDVVEARRLMEEHLTPPHATVAASGQ
jgi:DNA-binding FadR family transcriptional regulator